jgi:hypothetical protein
MSAAQEKRLPNASPINELLQALLHTAPNQRLLLSLSAPAKAFPAFQLAARHFRLYVIYESLYATYFHRRSCRLDAASLG